LGSGRSRERLERQRQRLQAEGYEFPAEPRAEDAPRLHDVRCFKCGAKIAEVERWGRDDVIILPPDQVEYSGPLPHPWTIVVWCRRCRERRALIQHPVGPVRENDANGKNNP
jgi:hypothetical protein